MNKILLSIKPKFVNLILNKTKRFEYRTAIPKTKINEIYIYASFPVKRIVAKAKVLKILKLPPDELWDSTKEYSGIEETYFKKYFNKRNICYAYKLGKIEKINKTLEDIGVNKPPQNFVYIKQK